MTDQARADTTQLHEGNDLKLKVEDGDDRLENSQAPMMLIDPEDFESGFTHSQETPTHEGPKKVPLVTATKRPAVKPVVKVKANGAPQQDLQDKELPAGTPDGVNVSQIDNDTDPAAGYLEKEAGLPVINNASAAVFDEDEFEDPVDPDGPTAVEGDEFDDLPTVGAEAPLEGEDGEEFEDFGSVGDDAVQAPVEEMGEMPVEEPVEEVADFEAAPVTNEQVPLVDADEVPDFEGSDDLVFASFNKSLHVIRSNRIIASMGPLKARKLGVEDVYLGDQFQDILAHAIDTKGLRKGLVQQGMTLARVKVTSSKSVTKVVQAKVDAAMAAKIEAAAKRDRAMEQSLAIAAVGINKRYFRTADNTLKSALVDELKRAGVKGAAQLVAAVFAEHGVSYAKSILTLANKIAAMPDEVRDQHADSLDMTSDEDFEPEEDSEVDSGLEEEEDEFNPVASVTAALASPQYRRIHSSSHGSASALSARAILLSDQPLV